MTTPQDTKAEERKIQIRLLKLKNQKRVFKNQMHAFLYECKRDMDAYEQHVRSIEEYEAPETLKDCQAFLAQWKQDYQKRLDYYNTRLK